MSAKHTPGPWGLDSKPISIDVFELKTQALIAEVQGVNAESRATARLIVAAPDMYVLLRHVIHRVSDLAPASGEDVLADIDALLARIDGDQK